MVMTMTFPPPFLFPLAEKRYEPKANMLCKTPHPAKEKRRLL
jgi:hypothetical protein